MEARVEAVRSSFVQALGLDCLIVGVGDFLLCPVIHKFDSPLVILGDPLQCGCDVRD